MTKHAEASFEDFHLPFEPAGGVPIYAALSERFDAALQAIPHYALYPEMRVAIGAYYTAAPAAILVLGESHYLDQPRPENAPDRWYVRRELHDKETCRNINTRNVFNNAILRRKPSKSKAIFHALADALHDSGLTMPGAHSALQSVAYMNFFQRPAERPKLSIQVHRRDIDVATSVLLDVAAILKPELVVFASRLAARHGRDVITGLHARGVRTVVVPHPSCAWWNRESAPMGGKTGRERFMDAVRECRGLAAGAPSAG
jgi:hypothetical protein